MARHDQSDQAGIGVLDGKPNVVSKDAPRWRPDVLDDPGAAEKADVLYRDGKEGERCGECEMFVGAGDDEASRCTAVKGEIDSDKVCDLFEPAAG